MAPSQQMPEPANKAIVLVGAEGEERVFLRDDTHVADTDPDHWWEMPSKVGDPSLSWPQVWALGNVCRYYSQAELDQAVAKAGVTPVGEHLKEPGGWCRTHSIQHSEVEWARIHDQLAEERGSNA